MTQETKTNSHVFTDFESLKRFMLAGKAVLTAVLPALDSSLTIKISKPDDGRQGFFFVAKRLSNNWGYIGMLESVRERRLGPDDNWIWDYAWRFRVTRNSYKLHQYQQDIMQQMVMSLNQQRLPFFPVMHEGQCCVCGRSLTNPESIQAGIGPECAGRI